ncbi:MAG: response regulator transcription factor [Actinomycetota bacterium]|nr:response regulator transcription factor [Actinomycetota bacterium]
MVRDGLRLILELGGITVLGEARDGEEALAVTQEHEPDVVLMDLRMPATDGIEATRRIVEAGLPSRVLALTTFDLDNLVYEALRAGAVGFLLKDVTAERLIAAVEDTAAGRSPVSAPVLTRIIAHFVERPPAGVIRDQGSVTELSERELEVLALIGAGRSNTEIADELVISIATVKSHVRHILAKLDLRDRVHAVVFAHETGLVAGQGT